MNMPARKQIEDLTVRDLENFPVWQYANDDEEFGETFVTPVEYTPVETLANCFVGTQVQLANGDKVWASIGNVDTSDARSTRHFLTLSVFRDERWFTMARYHDFDIETRGPKKLAEFLKLPIGEIFPISYDISRFCQSEPAFLIGTIEGVPNERLTAAQLMALATP